MNICNVMLIYFVEIFIHMYIKKRTLTKMLSSNVTLFYFHILKSSFTW